MSQNKQTPSPHIIVVKIMGANEDAVKELQKIVELSGFDLIHKTRKMLFDKDTQQWRVYIWLHEEPAVKIDEALMSVEGVRTR